MLVVDELTCRFGSKTAVDKASFSIPAGQFHRRHRPLRRRQIHPAAHDQPAGRAERRPRSCSTAPTSRRCGRGAAPLARALRHDLPAVQPGRPARRADQRADGPAGDGADLALAGAAVAGRGQGDRHVGAGAVRHGRRSPRSAPTSCPAASSSASRSPARWCRSRTSSSPTSRSPRSTRATRGS